MGIEKNTTKLNIVSGLNEKIDVGCDEVMRPARGDHIVNGTERFSGADVVERNAKNGDGRSGREWKTFLKPIHGFNRSS